MRSEFTQRERVSSGNRLPPHSREAERALIGSMMHDSNIVAEISRLIRATDYYVFAHQKIHEIIVELHGRGIPVDTVTVAEALQDRGLMDEIGGPVYLVDLWDASPSASHYRQYITIIRQYAKRRTLAHLAAEVEGLAYDLAECPDRTAEYVTTQIYELRDAGNVQDIEKLVLPGGQWPVLGDAAYYGIVGDIVTHLEPETEADPVGILIQLLIALGNAIGRSAYSRVEGDRHYCNLFGVGVGKSGHGRKGTGWGRTRQLMAIAESAWLEQCIGSGMSSGEGLINRLRDTLVVEEGNTQTILNGVSDKRLLAIETEFGGVLNVLRRDGSNLSANLRNAWDSGFISTLTKNPVRASNVHISIIGHITIEELRKCLGEVDVFNGFANRFLWFLVKRSKILPEGGRMLELGPLSQRLADAITYAKNLESLDRADAMRELWFEKYPKLTTARPGLAGVVTGRAEAQVLRLSTLYAALDHSPVIMVAHLQAALAVWAYCEESARQIFGSEERLDRLSQGVLECLKAAGDVGRGRYEVHCALGRHHSTQRILDALVALRDAGKARTEDVPTKGRPQERWFAVGDSVQPK